MIDKSISENQSDENDVLLVGMGSFMPGPMGFVECRESAVVRNGDL